LQRKTFTGAQTRDGTRRNGSITDEENVVTCSPGNLTVDMTTTEKSTAKTRADTLAAAVNTTSDRPSRRRVSTRRDPHAIGLFVIETKNSRGRWTARSTRCSVETASDFAWELLAKEGGEVRVRRGRYIVAEGLAVTR
jgi:hypothetical protein